MQEIYAETHPASVRGVSLGFNRDWIGLTGATPAQREALACLRPDFTAKSGIFPGEPDIWDFNNTTMYEITTESGRAFRVGKLAAELALANSLTALAECSGLLFTAGDWVPPGACYWIGGDLFISVRNDRGVLAYRVYKDISKELALAARFRRTPSRPWRPESSCSPRQGRGEARPGGEEPLVQLFQAMSAKGTPVPPEIQELIESKPELKAKLEKAMKQGGDPTDVQKQLSQDMLDIIQANKDRFSAEDLELLLDTTGAVADKVPQGKLTFDTVQKLLDEKRAGKGGGGKGGDQPAGGQAPTAEPSTGQVPKAEPKAPNVEGKGTAPVRKLWEAITGPGQGPPVTDDSARRFFDEIPADLTEEQVNALITRLGPVGDASRSTRSSTS